MTVLPLESKAPEGIVLPSDQQEITLTHNLSEGSTLSVLDWGWNRNVGCFNENESHWFHGNHRYYILNVPEYNDVTIDLSTKDPHISISMFAYILPSGVQGPLPPGIQLAAWCKSVHDTNFSRSQHKTLSVQSHERAITLIIGIAGASLTFNGDYDLAIKKRSRTEPASSQSIPIIDIQRKYEQKLLQKGDLNAGLELPVQWANRPEVACFPGLANPMFSGKHQFFRVSMKPFERLDITAFPMLLETDVNIYAYTIPAGQNPPPLPPEVTTRKCLSSGGVTKKNPGVPESVSFRAGATAEDIIIGVTSPAGLSEGEFVLRLFFE